MVLPGRYKRDHDHATVDPTAIAIEFSFKPRSLRRCVNGALQGTSGTEPCMEARGQPEVVTTVEREARRSDMKVEAQSFHNCLCDLHHLTDNCKFSLLVIQPNRTALNGCFENPEHNINTPLYHDGSNSNFTCDLRASHRIRCRRNNVHVKPKETRFQSVLNCLSSSLKYLACPATTTAAPMLTTPTTTKASNQTQMIIFIMALVISLLLGILGTWLGIVCWRKRRKRNNRPLPPLMTRPEHASLPNLYDEEYNQDHIYDVVKHDDSPTHPVPDLLSRVPSLPPMTNRTPKSRIHVEPDKSKAAFDKTETYEPLLRGHSTSPDRHNTDPKTPVPADETFGNDYLPLLPDRTSGEISPSDAPKRVHPYDSINESEVGVEAQDESITTPKMINDSPRSPNKTGNEYFILEPQPSSLVPEQGSGSPERCEARNNPNDSGCVVSPSENVEEFQDDDTNYNEMPVRETDRDSDGYEIPVPEETSFDIASSFVKKGPRVVEEDRENSMDV